MFTNLIESSSHAKEFKRRGSFVLFTTGTYVLLFVVTGVVSIYAYDARLEEQNLEMVTLISPQDIAPKPPEVTRPVRDNTNDRTAHNNNAFDVRRNPTAAVDQPTLTPEKVSTAPNPDLPVRGSVPFKIGSADSNAILPGGTKGVAGPSTSGVQVNIPDELPPPPPAQAPPKILKFTELINSHALVLPKPPYPPLAKQIRLQGTVVIQVLIDENGKVLSARPVSGHPMLLPEAQRAAMQAKFSPTTLNGVAVKVSGMISYNFQMPQ
ncbi:MAG TPA: energy transducer TonB [Pyrinomonadaceae bacterium]|jgi:TonB family protein